MTNISAHEVEVHEDLGDDGYRRDRHRCCQEEWEDEALSGLARSVAGMNQPRRNPEENESVIPPRETPTAILAWRRMSARSVSSPVMRRRKITPMRETTSRRYPCTAVCGTIQEPTAGIIELRSEGPRRIPARISPTTDGWPRRCAISPSPRAARRRTAICMIRARISWCEAAEKTSVIYSRSSKTPTGRTRSSSPRVHLFMVIDRKSTRLNSSHVAI